MKISIGKPFKILSIGVFLVIFIGFNSYADFMDVAPQYGLNVSGYTGITIYDYDNDGDEDIYAEGHLLKNDGTGHFTDVSIVEGLSYLPNGEPQNNAWTDFDKDGDMDLLIMGNPVILMKNNLFTSGTLENSIKKIKFKSKAEDGDYLKILVTDNLGRWNRPGSTITIKEHGSNNVYAYRSVASTQSDYIVTVGLDEHKSYDMFVKFPTKGGDSKSIENGPETNPGLSGVISFSIGHFLEIREFESPASFANNYWSQYDE